MNASVEALAAAQNADGGWGYRGGGSWTEPTVYALLALAAQPAFAEPRARGLRWLSGLQRADGGWPPRAGVDASTWVTAPVLFLLARRDRSPALEAAVRWLLSTTGKESSFLYRLRQRLSSIRVAPEDPEGWPFYPDTAAWVAPTVWSILALRRLNHPGSESETEARIEAGRRYLLARQCQDGGWNHGSSRALGYEASSYPETTGLVLLALSGVAGPAVSKAILAAERHLAGSRSVEAWCWLTLGLRAHRRDAGGEPPASPRTVTEVALCLMAKAAQTGSHPLVG